MSDLHGMLGGGEVILVTARRHPLFLAGRLSLYKMHELALHGFPKMTLDTLARLITRRTEPHVKLH